MNFNKYIGFGNFSDSQSSEADVHVVPNPHYSVNNTSAYESYVILAWDTSGSVLDISYFDSLIASYSSNTMSNLFSFAVLQIPSCQLAGKRWLLINTLKPPLSQDCCIKDAMNSMCPFPKCLIHIFQIH